MTRHRFTIRWAVPLLLAGGCSDRPPPAPTATTHTREARDVRDDDCDGIPTDVEKELGLDPYDPADGNNDYDGDTVPTAIEVRLGGNPKDPDTDGDSVDDRKDLATDLDLDGDGKLTWNDTCPDDVDAAQLDADFDGIGDMCDPTPKNENENLTLLPIHEAYVADARDWALRPAGRERMSRLSGDRMGMLSMPQSFRILAAPLHAGGAVSLALLELYHPVRRDHAYVTSELDHSLLLRQGYEDRGALGYVTRQPLAFGETVELRRFRRSSDGHEAVVFEPAVKQTLQDEGYVDVGRLGYALTDEGRVRRPVTVVRTRSLSMKGQTRHHRQLVSEPDAISEGPRFRVWPERLGKALPLYRLRDKPGFEVLSSDADEVRDLLKHDYTLDGILGWVLVDEAAMPVVELRELWRLEDPDGGHVYSADPEEIATLVTTGHKLITRLGFVAASDERAPSCAGPTPAQKLEAKLGATAGDPRNQVRTLSMIVASCTIARLLDGNAPATAYEATIAAKLPADPEIKRRLRANVGRWQELDPAVRAGALGELAPLDPGNCSSPVDLAVMAEQVGALLFQFLGPPPSLREPFCDGTLYATGDPSHGTPDEARAVTINSRNGGEISMTFAGKPALQGVLDTELVRGHPVLEAAAAANPDLGYPLDGVPTGMACMNDAGCSATQGLKCINSECRAFPILRNTQGHTFTGMNLWDVIDGQIVFEDTITNAVHRIPDTITAGEPADDSRCDLQLGPRNHATIDTLPLVTGRFYRIHTVNTNGNYFEHDETVPSDENEARTLGRTIHVCYDPLDFNRPPNTIGDCESVRSPEAACPVDGPPCGATNGGRWGLTAGQRPRSLQACSAPGVSCGETPREFSSEDGAPRFVFVEAEPPPRTIVATLEGLTCTDETGWDRWGSDELVVSLMSFGGLRPPGDMLAMGDAFERDTDSGDHDDHIGHELGTLSLLEATGTSIDRNGDFVLTLMEDDEWAWKVIVGGIVIGAATVALATVCVPCAYASGGVGLAYMAAVVAASDDDLLGSSTFRATVFDITDRGVLSHDSVLTPLPPLSVTASEYERTYEISVHPAVDNDGYAQNLQVRTCMGGCNNNELCSLGVCVPNDWTDTVPGVNNQPPGFVELRRYQHVDFWTGISDYSLYLGWHTR